MHVPFLTSSFGCSAVWGSFDFAVSGVVSWLSGSGCNT